MYKNEVKNSYKSVLDNQMNEHRMNKQIELAEKANLAMMNQQRQEMQRQQDSQMR